MLKQESLSYIINENMTCEKKSGLKKLANDFEWWRQSHHQKWIEYVILKIKEQGITDEDKEKIASIIEWKLFFETTEIRPSKFYEIIQESDFNDGIAESKEDFMQYLKDMGCDVDELESR